MLPFAPYRPSLAMQQSDTIETCLLTTTAQAFDIPAGAAFVQFSSTASFGCRFGTAAVAWPTTSSTAATGAEIFQPNIMPPRAIGSTKATTGFSLIAGAAGGFVSMSFYGPGG
jgi:hypothetical protein